MDSDSEMALINLFSLNLLHISFDSCILLFIGQSLPWVNVVSNYIIPLSVAFVLIFCALFYRAHL